MHPLQQLEEMLTKYDMEEIFLEKGPRYVVWLRDSNHTYRGEGSSLEEASVGTIRRYKRAKARDGAEHGPVCRVTKPSLRAAGRSDVPAKIVSEAISRNRD